MASDGVGGTFLGVDLGWTTGCTGLAVVDASGALVASARVMSDDEIVAWIAGHAAGVTVAAVDGPLIVTNDVGQREAERLIGVAFGGFGASAHTINRARYGGSDPRGKVLADRLGWRTDPGSGPGTAASPLCLEVYPHPALIGLFGLDYRLLYKKGPRAQRMAGMAALVGYIASVPELRVHEYPRWAELVAHVADPGPRILDRVEDELDAVVCAHLAWLWHHRPGTLEVYGDGANGYIVAPPRPDRRPVLPTPVTAGTGTSAPPPALRAAPRSADTPHPREHPGIDATLARLMTASLLDVYGERDPDRRWTAIRRTYTEDVVAADPREQVEGHAGVFAKAQSILDAAPGHEFRVDGELYQAQDALYLGWAFGPPGQPPAERGVDVAIVREGRISRLYTVVLD